MAQTYAEPLLEVELDEPGSQTADEPDRPARPARGMTTWEATMVLMTYNTRQPPPIAGHRQPGRG